MAQVFDVLPGFFKVFLSQTASESLAIPKSYNEHLKHPLPQTAKLQGSGGGGRTWTVNFTKIRERVYFTHGWSNFAEDHHLKDGDFLTFVYDGYRTFQVTVFGRSGCNEIRAAPQTIISLSDSDSNSEEDTSMDSDGEEISQSIYMVDTDETDNETAVVVDNPALEVITNPCFNTNLKNRPYELLIPSSVIKDYGLSFTQSITYVDVQGSLTGQKGKWPDKRICFKSWDSICRRNRLKEEDTIMCELLHKEKVVHSVKVHITRG